MKERSCVRHSIAHGLHDSSVIPLMAKLRGKKVARKVPVLKSRTTKQVWWLLWYKWSGLGPWKGTIKQSVCSHARQRKLYPKFLLIKFNFGAVLCWLITPPYYSCFLSKIRSRQFLWLCKSDKINTYKPRYLNFIQIFLFKFVRPVARIGLTDKNYK